MALCTLCSTIPSINNDSDNNISGCWEELRTQGVYKAVTYNSNNIPKQNSDTALSPSVCQVPFPRHYQFLCAVMCSSVCCHHYTLCVVLGDNTLVITVCLLFQVRGLPQNQGVLYRDRLVKLFSVCCPHGYQPTVDVEESKWVVDTSTPTPAWQPHGGM